MRILPLLLLLSACGVTPAQHAANVVEGASQEEELRRCRAEGREAKKDGGSLAYLAAYEACAEKSDAKHGLDGGR